jgi:hypothetical protein
VAPVIGGFLTTIQELKTLSACHDALPCVSSWQQDIAVCIVTKRLVVLQGEMPFCDCYRLNHNPLMTNSFLHIFTVIQHFLLLFFQNAVAEFVS